ncbi:MAG: ferritin-like domain-containing protein [Dehalococcoidia bacterium]
MTTTREERVPLDLSWLNLDDQYGVAAAGGRRGLTLEDINAAKFNHDDPHAGNQQMRIRGAVPREGAPRFGYAYIDKADTWSEAVPMLYEEAIQRQWASATDIPWHTIEPLPEELERAMCQFCTFLTEVEFIAGDVPGQWLPKISPEYYEVGLFLMTQIMDEARHVDVFRKRALVNGGGLLAQGPGSGLRNLIEARDFTEMSAMLHVQAEGLVQSLFRMGELIGQNEAEKTIFRLCAQDESRHLAFGVMHLKHVLDTQPERREEIHGYFERVETVQAFSGTQQRYVTESLVVLMGGGTQPEQLDEGWKLQQLLVKKQMNEYYHRLKVAGLGDRYDRFPDYIRQYIDAA